GSRRVDGYLFGGGVDRGDHASDATFLPFRSLRGMFSGDVASAHDNNAGGYKRTRIAPTPAARQDAVTDSQLRRGDRRGVFEVFGARGYAEETSGFFKDDRHLRSAICLDRDAFGGGVNREDHSDRTNSLAGSLTDRIPLCQRQRRAVQHEHQFLHFSSRRILHPKTLRFGWRRMRRPFLK